MERFRPVGTLSLSGIICIGAHLYSKGSPREGPYPEDRSCHNNSKASDRTPVVHIKNTGGLTLCCCCPKDGTPVKRVLYGPWLCRCRAPGVIYLTRSRRFHCHDCKLTFVTAANLQHRLSYRARLSSSRPRWGRLAGSPAVRTGGLAPSGLCVLWWYMGIFATRTGGLTVCAFV